MKIILLCLVFLLTNPDTSTEAVIYPISKIKSTIQTVDFITAYNKIRKEEGFYSNHPNDKGAKTYCGITQKYNPDWYGWNYLNKYQLTQNQAVTGKDSLIVEHYVMDYYLDIWITEGFYTLTNQQIANYLFDMRIHIARKRTITLINTSHKTLQIQNKLFWITPQLNSLNINQLKEERSKYYLSFIKKYPEQTIWKKGWLKRANRI